MILLWIIIDQIKWEKRCKEMGWEPAVNMKERLTAYVFCILFPLIIGLMMGVTK